MSPKVLVVGDVMTDVIVVPEGPMVIGSDRRATVRQKPGGSGANQAVWLGAAGADVVFAGRVGATEKAGHEARFRAAGVTPVLAGDDTLPSGVLVTIVDAGGERSFLTDRGANLNLCDADLGDGLLVDVGLVMISGYALFAPGPRAAVQGLLARAREAGIHIAIDPASTGFLAEVGPGAFLDWVGEADWLFANAEEAAMLSDETAMDAQMRALGGQFETVVLKRGAEGAALGGLDGVAFTRPAQKVDVVDTTGAGDAFAAGFVAALLAGRPLETCLEAGIANGAAAVQSVGGQPNTLP